ncbi:hypothetical protein ABZT28_43510 [Streptomyces sp. NPDC005388]|uniref:hypothetical protein n=1 Tax=Streptomyces sp. NPDC005388 TaxID=3156717 RepID=UPI0033B0A564
MTALSHIDRQRFTSGHETVGVREHGRALPYAPVPVVSVVSEHGDPGRLGVLGPDRLGDCAGSSKDWAWSSRASSRARSTGPRRSAADAAAAASNTA